MKNILSCFTLDSNYKYNLRDTATAQLAPYEETSFHEKHIFQPRRDLLCWKVPLQWLSNASTLTRKAEKLFAELS